MVQEEIRMRVQIRKVGIASNKQSCTYNIVTKQFLGEKERLGRTYR